MEPRALEVLQEWERSQRVRRVHSRTSRARREVPVEERSRVTDEVRDAWGSFVVGLTAQLGGADLFGGLTYDQRRRGEQRMKMRRPLHGIVGGEQLRAAGTSPVPGRVEKIGGAEFINAPTFEATRAHVYRFLDEASGLLHRRVEGIVALERQKNGWPHAHPLLMCGGLSGNEISQLGGFWWRRFGGNRLSVPRSVDDVCAYAAKYLVKDIDQGDVVFSRGLRRAAGGFQGVMRVGR
jgi:hypothetical protein